MENRNTFRTNNTFDNSRGHFIANQLDDRDMSFEDSFRAYPKTSMNWFGYFEESQKYDNPLSLEFSNKPNNLVERPIFNFEDNLFRDNEDNLRSPFNFFRLESPVDKARSYEKELTDDFEMSFSHLCYSADLKTIYEFDEKLQQNIQKQNNIRQFTAKKDQKEIRHQNLLWDSSEKIEDKKSSYSSVQQSSVDPESLSNLLKCLEKSKGVNKNQITIDIVARTIEFGQKKVAEELNIPYRRYKSILNKWGIKTAAGRKVNNLQLESDLVEWALKIKDSGLLLTRKMIRDKASEFSKEHAKYGEKTSKKVSLSKGWLDKFVKRHEEIKDYLTSQKGRKGL